ncbi:MAG: Crp/Fnr family transcriptional regulator [Pseudomonadota bacterium]
MQALAELQRFTPFKALAGDSQTLLAQGLVTKQCGSADMALHKGQPVSGAYVVLAGRLRVFSLSPNGTEATLYFIDPGETCVLALNCLFNDLLYPAWVQAETPSTIALIPGAVYRRLFEREPAIQNLTVHTLSTLVFRLMSELELVHSSHHKQRLANFILMQSASDGVLHMTQQQLAQHLGTTREVVARLLQEFVARGWVSTRRGAIAIKDLFGLRELVSPGAS